MAKALLEQMIMMEMVLHQAREIATIMMPLFFQEQQKFVAMALIKTVMILLMMAITVSKIRIKTVLH
jgi:hypothetical protein